MTYAPNPGDIGLVEIGGPIGRAIRAAQWANGDGFKKYEHAFDYVGGDWIVEAEPGGALRSRLSRYAAEKVLWLRCPRLYGDDVAAAAEALVGVPYSYADYVALAAHRFHIPYPHLKTYIKESGHMICSQLVDRAALRGGWHIFADGRWEGDVTPADLAREALRQA